VARRDERYRGISFPFAAIPIEVLRSPQWIALPPSAVKLAMALAAQYTGRNNGKLCPAFEALANAGYTTSKPTLISAKRALFECDWCVQTRQGHAPRTADWVGFTWWKLDWEKSMDIEPRQFPYLNFIKAQIADPNRGRGEAPKTVGGVKNLYRSPSNQGFGGKETKPMGDLRTA